MNPEVLNAIDAADPATLSTLSDEDLVRLANEMLEAQAFDRQVNQLRHYKPVSPTAVKIHCCTGKVIGVGGGNGASKTDTALVEMVIRAAGQIPLSLRDVYPREKLRGPINCRVVVESITNTLETIILPKLQWEKWQGVDSPGGPRGHFGWIPKHCLKKGEWSESWTARTRTLEVLYFDPDTDQYRGLSRIQFMSYDQDSKDFASGDFHFVLHDEPPKESIWVENLVRTKRVDGTMMMAMTWPDDPTTPVDWIIDRVWERCQPGKDRDPNYFWFDQFATDNMNLNQTALAELARDLSAEEKARRIYGQHLRLSNRVHPNFTDTDKRWCFHCHDLTILTEEDQCGKCHGSDTVEFNHVGTVKCDPSYPVVCLLDPHPRKPHMLLYVQIDPNDDWGVIHELEVTGSPADVRQRCQDIESDYGWTSVTRMMDPNMGRSPSGTDREVTWQDAFEREGLVFDLANDGAAGRQIINDMLKPDPFTHRPRITFDMRCMRTIYQLKRYAWSDHKLSSDKDQKQDTKKKFDDFPTLLKYLANAQPSFRSLKSMGQVWKRDVGSYLG